jgi:hypothetical protein
MTPGSSATYRSVATASRSNFFAVAALRQRPGRVFSPSQRGESVPDTPGGSKQRQQAVAVFSRQSQSLYANRRTGLLIMDSRFFIFGGEPGAKIVFFF